jgi:large subunit ribosomal protein L31
MRAGIHPDHKLTEVSCTCGNKFHVLSRHETLTVDICSACHPFYTGTQKFVDTAGRVDAFTRRFQWNQDQAAKQAEKKVKSQGRKVKKDLKTELEKKKVFGKKKSLPTPDEKGEKGGRKD